MTIVTIRNLLAVLVLALASGPAQSEEIAGDWIGRMPSGFTTRMHVEKGTDGYSATLTSPGGSVTPLERLASDGATLRFSAAALGLSYEGRWDEGRRIWAGTLNFQGVHQFDFRRATAAELLPASRRRPQEEAIRSGSLPYTEQEVVFDSAASGIRLAGSLMLPRGNAPFPAVLLISGTGPNLRDSDVDGHKTLLVVADALARSGLAVLRYDKRGVGGSTGVYPVATTADFAADAQGAVQFLRRQGRIDPARIGLLGHSEGGVIAPMVAARDSSIAFVILLAAPGLRGDRIFTMQAAATARTYGVPDDYITRRRSFDEALYKAILSAPSVEEARARATALAEAGVKQKLVDAAEARTLPADKTGAWARYFMAHDPGPVLRRLTMPVLALGGSLDTQVPARENLAAMREALRGNANATIIELDGLNHLLQSARTGGPNEYAGIEETMAPAVLKMIADWSVALVR